MNTLFGGGLLTFMMDRYGAAGMLGILAVTVLAVFLLGFLIKRARRRN